MLSDESFRQLLEHLNRPWRGYRKVRKGVKKRVRRHMDVLGCDTIEVYLKRLDHDHQSRKDAEAALRVTISRFFRDRMLWQALAERILPAAVQCWSPPLRIWSAGCASGEEAYSMAMVWDSLLHSPPVEILATDLDTACLERAVNGRYPASSLKEVPADLKERYFDARKGGRQYIIRAHRLPSICWRQHDLMGTPPEEERFHLILLRNNLLTYHQGGPLRAAFERIVDALVPNGYLITGSHEKIPDADIRWARDDACPLIYRRRERS